MSIEDDQSERIQKLLSRYGLGSRRIIEQWIEHGRIQINGQIAKLGDRASRHDNIIVDQQPIRLQSNILACALMYHKPRGEIVSHKDERDRPTVFASLPKPPQGRWVSVGRLDCNTSGLLVCCNDGELAKRMMHPSWHFPREYRVRVRGRVDDALIQRLLHGVRLGTGFAKFSDISEVPPKEQKEEGTHGVNQWFRVVLHEGKNREVRRLWESQGLEVSHLHRDRFGDVVLDAEYGRWRWLSQQELASLYRRVSLPVPDMFIAKKDYTDINKARKQER